MSKNKPYSEIIILGSGIDKKLLGEIWEALKSSIKAFCEALDAIFDELFNSLFPEGPGNNKFATGRRYPPSCGERLAGEYLIAYGGPGPRRTGRRMGGWKGQRISGAPMLYRLGRGRSISGHKGLSVDGRGFLTSFSPLGVQFPGAPKEQMRHQNCFYKK